MNIYSVNALSLLTSLHHVSGARWIENIFGGTNLVEFYAILLDSSANPGSKKVEKSRL